MPILGEGFTPVADSPPATATPAVTTPANWRDWIGAKSHSSGLTILGESAPGQQTQFSQGDSGKMIKYLESVSALMGKPDFDWTPHLKKAQDEHVEKFGVPWTTGRSNWAAAVNAVLPKVGMSKYNVDDQTVANVTKQIEKVQASNATYGPGDLTPLIGILTVLTAGAASGAFAGVGAAAEGAAVAAGEGLIGTGGTLVTGAEAATAGAIYSAPTASFGDILMSQFTPEKIGMNLGKQALTSLATGREPTLGGVATGLISGAVGGVVGGAAGGGIFGSVAGMAASAGTSAILGGLLNSTPSADTPAPPAPGATPTTPVPSVPGGAVTPGAPGANGVPSSFSMVLAPYQPKFNRYT